MCGCAVFVDVMLLLRKLQNVLLGPGVMLALVLLGPNWNTGGLGPPRAVLRNVFTYLRTCWPTDLQTYVKETDRSVPCMLIWTYTFANELHITEHPPTETNQQPQTRTPPKQIRKTNSHTSPTNSETNSHTSENNKRVANLLFCWPANIFARDAF